MSTNRDNPLTRMLCILTLTGATTFGVPAQADSICTTCRITATLAKMANTSDARSAYYLDIGKANNLVDQGERRTAIRDARSSYFESIALIHDQYDARIELCGALGECLYDPLIAPENFVGPSEAAANPNPYFPLTPGLKLTYRGETDEGEIEIIEVEVLDETIEILGIECTVVRDTVTIEGERIEDTFDWYAQDTNGAVWYMGELSKNYEDGELDNLDGSWRAGVDGAKPGILAPATAQVGDVYRQEWLLGEAEDAAEVLALDQQVSLAIGTFTTCRLTGEFTPIEPDGYEEKYFAPGIGMVLEIKPETGEMVELIAIETP